MVREYFVMEKTMMKTIRLISLLMAFLLLIPAPAGLATEADEGGEGTVEFFEVPELDPTAEEVLTETEPFIPDGMEKTIFNEDDRITVKNPSKFPYSAIAYLNVTGECGCTWTGTGFMVSKDQMLTAGHCLRCIKHYKWPKKITFYFGYKNARSYLYKYTGRWRIYVGNLYEDREYTTDWDFGCIRFAQNVGDRTGWFGSRYGLSDKQLDMKFMNVAGYRDGVLKYDTGFVEVLSSQHLKYRMDTLPGNSGGPVYDPDYYAVGINIAQNNSYNIGFRLVNFVREQIDALEKP